MVQNKEYVYVAKEISELCSKGVQKKPGSLYATDIIITLGHTDRLV